MSKKWSFFVLALAHGSAGASPTVPFHGCTFYKPSLIPHFHSCGEFSVKIGRNQCKKTKGSRLFGTTYPGSHIRMWLPDFFIEVTKHSGKSLFAESLDALGLKNQLNSIPKNPIKHGSSSSSGGDNFWHARILDIPYNALANSYPPLPIPIESAIPSCFKGVSEFYDPQWNLNLVDAPYAAVFAPLGVNVCSHPGSSVIKAIPRNPGVQPEIRVPTHGNPCAVPVTLPQAQALNGLPTAEAARTFANPARLCLGSWGPVIPRTGWIPTDDLSMSALIAAFKFQSLTSDMQLSPDLAPQDDDKWQMVFPKTAGGGGCFRPGSATYFPQVEMGREVDEFVPGGVKKHHTYVIAVWRKKESCEEPLPFEAYQRAFEANFTKNKSFCSTLGDL